MTRSDDEKKAGKLLAQCEKNPDENLFLAGVRLPPRRIGSSCIDADRIQKLTCAAVVALLFLRSYLMLPVTAI